MMSAAHGRRGMDILERRIAPGAFHDSGRKYDLPKCHLRTRAAILAMLSAWVEDAAPSPRGCGILWLYGPPGAGKSSLAQTIAQMSFERGLLAASFFFDRNTPGLNTEKHLMATLAHQISNTVPEAGRYIAEAVERDPGVFSGSLESQLQALIVGPLVAAHAAHNASLDQQSPDGLVKQTQPPKKWARLLVIDALDSCHGAAVQRYIVRILSTALIHKRVPLFILVSSRPLPPIRDSFNSYDLRDLLLTLPLDDRTAYLPDSEIKRYLWSRFEYIRMTHPLKAYIPASWPSASVIQALVARTAGQFVYASSVVKYVDSAAHRPVERLDAVLRIQPGQAYPTSGAASGSGAGAQAQGANGNGNGEVPFAELDALYRHVLGGVANSKAVLRILGAILFAQRLYSSRSPSSSLLPPSSLPSSLPSPAGSSAAAVSPNNTPGEGGTPIPVTDPRFLEEILGLSRGDVPFVLQDLHSIVYVPVPDVGAQAGAQVQGRRAVGSASGSAGVGVQREATVVPAHGGGVGTPTTSTHPSSGNSNSNNNTSTSATGAVPVMHALHPASMGIQPGTQVVAYGSAAAHPHPHPPAATVHVQGQGQYGRNTQAYGAGAYAAAGGGSQIQAYGGGAAGGASGAGVGGLEGRGMGAAGEPVLVAYTRGGQQFSARGSPQSASRSPTVGQRDVVARGGSGERVDRDRERERERERDRDRERERGGHRELERERPGSAGHGHGQGHGHSVSGGSATGSPVRRATHPYANGNGNGHNVAHGRGGHAHGAYRAHPYDPSARPAVARTPPAASASSTSRAPPYASPHAHTYPRKQHSSPLHAHAQGPAQAQGQAQAQTSGTVSTAPATSTGIRILHSSLIDFLTDRSRAGRYFINSVKVHAELARSCVRNLLSGHKYVHQYAGQALVTHCRYSVLTHELHTDLLHFDLGVWLATCKTWSDGGYGESVYALEGAEVDLMREEEERAVGRSNGHKEKEDVPRMPGYAVGPYDQAWIELPGLFHWFKTLTYADPAKDLHAIHMANWEQYLLAELPRYTAHPGLEALLVFASLPPEPVSFTTTTASKSKLVADALETTSPTTTSPTAVTSPSTTTSPTVVTSPTSATSASTSSALTATSTPAWSFDWLHVWPLLGIAPREATRLEAADRAALHFTGLRPNGGFESYRGMVRDVLVGRGWGVDKEEQGKGEEEKRGKAETVARVAECVCRYLMEPKKAGQIYPYRLPAEWTWFRAGHDDAIFRENRAKETFQAGLVYLPFLLMHAARSEGLVGYLRMRDEGLDAGITSANGHGAEGDEGEGEERIRSIDMIRAKELPRLAWAEDKARAEEAVRAYLARCEEEMRPRPISKPEGDAMEVDDGVEPERMETAEAPTQIQANRTPTPRASSAGAAADAGVGQTTATPATTNTPTPTPSTAATTTTPSAEPEARLSVDAGSDGDSDVDVNLPADADANDNTTEHPQANTSGDVDMDAEGESDADADADADADTDPEGERDVLPKMKEEDEMDTGV